MNTVDATHLSDSGSKTRDAPDQIPTVSVGLLSYNDEAYIAKAITDILAQTHTDIELIISDDCSRDGSDELCRGFAREDGRVRYFRQATQLGCQRSVSKTTLAQRRYAALRALPRAGVTDVSTVYTVVHDWRASKYLFGGALINAPIALNNNYPVIAFLLSRGRCWQTADMPLFFSVFTLLVSLAAAAYVETRLAVS